MTDSHRILYETGGKTKSSACFCHRIFILDESVKIY